MKKTKIVSMYLAGSIQKGHEKSELEWSQKEIEEILKSLPGWKVHLLNPAFRKDSMHDSLSIFGRDMIQVASADILFVDAREKRGLGVGAEMMWARFHKKYIISLAPLGSHYVKAEGEILGTSVSPYIHPFVACLSDVIVENISEGCRYIEKYMKGEQSVKSFDEIYHSMQHYLDTQFQNDEPMHEHAQLLETFRRTTLQI